MNGNFVAKKAFSLVEVLIVVFIVSVVFTSFYTVSMVGTSMIIEAKNRLAAVALANEKMEIVRNLPYDKVGTQGSVDIPGNLLQSEQDNVNGRTFNVTTSIHYVDDPLDGTVTSSPVDDIPNDYKLAQITVSWKDSKGQNQNVVLTSRFVPPGLETKVGGSPLSLNVVSSDGTGVSQASIHITNNMITPAVSDTVQADASGHMMLPAALVGSSYHLVISKSGYETVNTMDATPMFTPMYKHVDVIAGALNQYSFEQNKLANLHVQTMDYQNNPVPNIAFSIGGGKIIGHDNLGNYVYLMSNTSGNELFGLSNTNGTTDTNGQKNYTQISPGTYNISMDTNADYQFIDFDPSVSPEILTPGSDMTYTMKVAHKNVAGLFLTINDSTDNAPISGATATLTDNSGNQIFSGKESSLRGVIFYPDSVTPLTPGDYTLEISANGYASKTQNVTIPNSLVPVQINLDRN